MRLMSTIVEMAVTTMEQTEKSSSDVPVWHSLDVRGRRFISSPPE